MRDRKTEGREEGLRSVEEVAKMHKDSDKALATMMKKCDYTFKVVNAEPERF